MNTLIIFDLDGTLADTRADLANAVNLTREDYGLPKLSIEEIVKYVGEGKYKLIERSFHDRPETDFEEATEKFSRHYGENLIIETPLYNGVKNGLKSLKEKNYHLAVLSNKPGDMCREITAHFKLDEYLIATMGGGDAEAMKPAPDGIYEIIKKAEAEGFRREDENVWMIGDHHTDLQVAKNAGLKSIYCNYGFGFKKDVSPDFSVDEFSEIEPIIAG